jgi:site-specific DNA-methyltransferase (adenine-specific)
MRSQPYYQDDFVTLYHGDCLTEHREWLDADVLVTDPPYGIAWKQNAYGKASRGAGNRTKASKGIQNDADTSARDEALSAFGEKPGIVFGDVLQPFPAGVKRVLVWQKPADAGFMGSSTWRKDWEPVFIVGKWPKSPATLSSVVPTSAGSHRQYAQGVHPHAKPLDVMENLITSIPAGVIADPFAGSGSTLVAAKALGRKVIGVELEEKYCEIAAKRCAQDVLDIFGAA